VQRKGEFKALGRNETPAAPNDVPMASRASVNERVRHSPPPLEPGVGWSGEERASALTRADRKSKRGKLGARPDRCLPSRCLRGRRRQGPDPAKAVCAEIQPGDGLRLSPLGASTVTPPLLRVKGGHQRGRIGQYLSGLSGRVRCRTSTSRNRMRRSPAGRWPPRTGRGSAGRHFLIPVTRSAVVRAGRLLPPGRRGRHVVGPLSSAGTDGTHLRVLILLAGEECQGLSLFF
jgi:hypothetical protein